MVKSKTQLDALKGTILAGQYRLARSFARGGFSILYSATRVADGLPVAVKILNTRAALREDPQARARFTREIASLKRLDHPNVVRIYDAGLTDAGHVYLVMERLFGATLSRQIAGSPLSLRAAGALLEKLLTALEHIHEVGGLIHRDIKPSNLLLIDPHRLGRRDGLKVIDFGFVKQLPDAHHGGASWDRPITCVRARVGTPGYMAPEMLREGSVTTGCDLYAAGIIGHEMLTGRPAFRGEGLARAQAQLSGDIAAAPPEVTQSPLYGVIERLYEPNPRRRYPSARDAIDALRPVLNALELEPDIAPPTPPTGPPRADEG